MSSRTYSITEPHPTVPTSHYIYTGRGGAGNFTKAPANLTPGRTASGPASRIPLTSHTRNQSSDTTSTSATACEPSAYYASGRGGAGNLHRFFGSQRERAIFSFDEELAVQRRLQERAAPVYHIGRGGAGNFMRGGGVGDREGKAGSVSEEEMEEGRRGSGEGVWRKMTRTLSNRS
ncbi:hypothetical protein EJ05DRAFT_505160 [Pseudovirgaria hyperparasitica]|uniref:Uncharacterized protein n=1 Tax=Pseudovirgaria hyperparasitica TaxID=470096 RepID=A0A6A6VWA4_9PEZI|nr:uncharacterized protein EJ05DRAFT_505160 [Pseudovirgaria hyperparasitica]KAF2753527.1 hypothetical protein EJ05DRAFT_505160 [Pseudovirgaria hyperparasitica]